MNKNRLLIMCTLSLFIIISGISSSIASDAYDIEHDSNFNKEMDKMGFKFDTKVGSDNFPGFSYKLKNPDDLVKYNMTGFSINTGDAYLKQDAHSDKYRPYEINNVSGYINEYNRSFITQIDNGHYIEYYADNIQNLNLIVKDYWV